MKRQRGLHAPLTPVLFGRSVTVGYRWNASRIRVDKCVRFQIFQNQITTVKVLNSDGKVIIRHSNELCVMICRIICEICM